VLGDVVICPAVAFRNAPEHAGSYDDEVALLVVHGLLHLMGMDHEDDDEAEAMEEREQALLAKFHRTAAGAAEGEATMSAGAGPTAGVGPAADSAGDPAGGPESPAPAPSS